jgi:hypothetical protein
VVIEDEEFADRLQDARSGDHGSIPAGTPAVIHGRFGEPVELRVSQPTTP